MSAHDLQSPFGWRYARSGAVLALLAGITASCGGGGGGPAPLTAATAPSVAAAVLNGFNTASGALFQIRGPGRGAFTGGNLLFAGFGLGGGIDIGPPPPEPPLLSLQRGTIDCPQSGSVVVAGTPDTEAELVAGATYSVTYRACAIPALFPPPPATDGRWDFTVTSFSGQLQGEYSLAADFSVAGFALSNADGAFRLAGDGSWVTSVGGGTSTETLLLDRLTASWVQPGRTVTVEFRDASFTGRTVGFGVTDQLLEGELGGTAVGGTVSVTTEAPIEYGSGGVPGSASGVYVVRSGSASMRVTLVASDQLEIELDADGDGTAETFLPVQLVGDGLFPRPT